MVRRMVRALCAAAIFLSACGGLEAPDDDYVDHDIGVITSGLTASQAGGCDTSIVSGLTQQLIAEVNCITPNTMTTFTGPMISFNGSVNPFLAPAATNGLKAAVAQRGVTIGISSAYRSVAQQYVLYKWWKAGQCGIQIAAVPGASNHQSGRALDVPSYSSWITPLQAHGWKWYGSGDLVHFDFNGAANLGGASVLAFQRLWNKNNANKLAEDGAWGPASSNAMAASPTTGFPKFGCAVVPPPPPPPVGNGTLKGRIYKLNPADAADLSQSIAGASVKVGGQALVTDGTGMYTAQLAGGAFTISATAAGFAPATLARQVVAGQTVWGSMGLSAVGVPDTVKPDVELSSPVEGAALELAALTVAGTASDDRGALAALTLSLNGDAPSMLTPGAFSHAVKLSAGLNTIVIEAADPAGNRTRLERTVTFRAGVAGVVTEEASGMPLTEVEVRLLDAADAVLASTRTAADGSYGFDAAPGSLTLVANRTGFAEYRQPVEVSADVRTSWSFSMAAGVPGMGVRFVFPREGEAVLTPTVWVSGVVDGFTPALVRVNGLRAELMQGNAFTVQLPLQVGDNLIEAVAARADGTVFMGRVQVVRLDAVAHEESTRARGGCSAAPGPVLLALGLLALALRRRRFPFAG